MNDQALGLERFLRTRVGIAEGERCVNAAQGRAGGREIKRLPGVEAQLRMAPKPVGSTFAYSGEAPSSARKSAVMITLIPDWLSNDGASQAMESTQAPSSIPYSVLFTLRQDSIRHGGQISFPGGRIDPGESALEAAVRETEEEVGIPAEAIQVIGPLTDLYMQHTHTLITPFIGILRSNVIFTPQEAEVREIFHIRIDTLKSSERLQKQQRDLRSILYEVPFWDIHSTPLWGATAMMLSEFMALVEEYSRG